MGVGCRIVPGVSTSSAAQCRPCSSTVPVEGWCADSGGCGVGVPHVDLDTLHCHARRSPLPAAVRGDARQRVTASGTRVVAPGVHVELRAEHPVALHRARTHRSLSFFAPVSLGPDRDYSRRVQRVRSTESACDRNRVKLAGMLGQPSEDPVRSVARLADMTSLFNRSWRPLSHRPSYEI